MAPSCWFVWSWWWLPMMLAVAGLEEQAEGCPGSPKRCGNLTISNPFWLRETEAQRPCGSSDFQITCHNNTPVLQSSIPFSPGFAIMDISYEEGTLHVLDQGKLQLLQASNSCGVPIWNTPDKLGLPFRINPVSRNLIIYNCTKVARGDRWLVETRMRCRNDSGVFVRVGGHYDAAGNYAADNIEGCNTSVVPVLGSSSSGEVNASDYERLISDGFVLTWDGLAPPPIARKFGHPSNHISITFLAWTSCSANGFLLTWNGPHVSGKLNLRNVYFDQTVNYGLRKASALGF